MSAASTAKRIAALNDALRSRTGMGWLPKSEVPGTYLATPGIAALTVDQKIEILRNVCRFDAFDESNDPYSEHDFGAFDVAGVGKVFFKIDYYGSAACDAGSEDPSDPAKSFRVLTIMLAEEY